MSGSSVLSSDALRLELLDADGRLGQRLVDAGAVTKEQLEAGLRRHERDGVRLGEALVQLGFTTRETVAEALAAQAGVPYLPLAQWQPDERIARLMPRQEARQLGVLPLYDDQDGVVVACRDLPNFELVRSADERVGLPVQPVLVSPAAFDDTMDRLYRLEYVEEAGQLLAQRTPENSASRVLSRGQKVFFTVLLVLVVLAALISPTLMAIAFVAVSTAFYVAVSIYKFYLASHAVSSTLQTDVTREEINALDDRDLPVYTILVPVYKEAEVFPILVDAIGKLDYPKAKLDVRILLEEDDKDTIAVAKASNLPSYFTLVVVPHGKPKGKPKACNYGMMQARGEFAVIYDAEDIPDPDQLKKALVAFNKGGDRLACVQAKLNYFNAEQNLLTRWFTSEYSMWFDVFLPGLDAVGAVIPLGGTSNHFRTAALADLGMWDPYNVTEDADLGVRLYKAGYKTAVIDSTTYEEANSEVYNWIRQRSRWVKGYIQTYLVHMRHPVRLYRALGPRAFWSFQLFIGGTFLTLLLNPVFWLMTVLWFATNWSFIKEIFPPAVFYPAVLAALFGNFTFTYLNVIGCLQREYWGMVKYALLSPLYWVIMSQAAWKGFLQLFYAPSYWEKTTHGLYKGHLPGGPHAPSIPAAAAAPAGEPGTQSVPEAHPAPGTPETPAVGAAAAA